MPSCSVPTVGPTSPPPPPPAPPPLPPPPPPNLQKSSERVNFLKPIHLVGDGKDHNVEPEEEVRFAAGMLRGYLAHKCSNFKENTVFVYNYSPIPSRIQDGPVCGLVALEMASKFYQKTVSLEEIIRLAQRKGATKNGEMFSVYQMAELAEEIYSCRTMVLEDAWSDQQLFLNHLLTGGVILVPYDKDCDARPCCKKGKKAHWAIITGVMLTTPGSSVDRSKLQVDRSKSYLYQSSVEIIQEILQQSSIHDVYVCGKQGSSLHLGLWEYEKLKQSNENLYELVLDIKNNLEDWVVPAGGDPLGQLRGKVVLLYTGERA